MTICLIGKNLTTLVLSKVLINKGLNVDLYYQGNKLSKNLSKTFSRTIGLSNESIDFLEEQKILKLSEKKMLLTQSIGIKSQT